MFLTSPLLIGVTERVNFLTYRPMIILMTFSDMITGTPDQPARDRALKQNNQSWERQEALHHALPDKGEEGPCLRAHPPVAQ